MTGTVRIQIGHYPRTTGSTGAWNAELRISEQAMNKKLAEAIEAAVSKLDPGRRLRWQFVGADERLYSPCDVFIALHMDGAVSKSARGGSFGYPQGSARSSVFVQRFKWAYQQLGLPSPLRSDNYTTGLSNYYGYKSAYSATAPVKMVFENGFTTNDIDVRWAEANRDRVAEMLVTQCLEHFGLTPAEGDVNEAHLEIAAATGSRFSWAVKLWQERLNIWGASLSTDGLVGPLTEGAHREWSSKHAPNTRRRPSQWQWNRLLGPPTLTPPPVPTASEEASEASTGATGVPTGVPSLETADEPLERQIDALEQQVYELTERFDELLRLSAERLVRAESAERKVETLTEEIETYELRVERAQAILKGSD